MKMKIDISNFPNNNIYKRNLPQLPKKNQALANDIFINSFSPKKSPSFRGLFSRIFKNINEVSDIEENQDKKSFAQRLSDGMKTYMFEEIPAENLKSIMTPSEFKEFLPKLKEENFTASKENIENGVYCADLDYQSCFSSGSENIFTILDNVAEYSEKYYEKTGENFVFALADRDSLEGLQHAIRIIGSEPEKYKHLKFVPAVKVSYTHEAPNSKIGFENSDVIVYGVNPFSPNVVNFIENNFKKRKSMIINFIKRVHNLYPEFAYSVIEFAKQNKIKYKKDFAVSNLYWRAREYAETKGDTEIKGLDMPPEKIIEDSNSILADIDELFLGSQDSGYGGSGSDIVVKDEVINHEIKKVFDDYSTHYDEKKGKVVSSAENLYSDMIDCFGSEPEKPVMAFASPYYFSHYYETKNPKTYDKVVEFIKNLQGKSKGMLTAFESVTPGYNLDKNLTPETVKKFNEFIRTNIKLYEVGGSFAQVKQNLSA